MNSKSLQLKFFTSQDEQVPQVYKHKHSTSIGSQRSRERYSNSKGKSFKLEQESAQKILLKSYREYQDESDFEQQVENFENYFVQNLKKETPIKNTE